MFGLGLTQIRHEDVLHSLGISGRTFAEQNEALVIELTRKFLDYVKSSRLEAATENTDQRDADSERIEIRMTPDGFPIIPKLVMDKELKKIEWEKELKKIEWEKLLRAFLTQHYCELRFRFEECSELESRSADLASGQKSKRVPFMAMKADTGSFILQNYRPLQMILQDPRNMHLDDIRKVLQHCYGLQAATSPESAFRFAAFL